MAADPATLKPPVRLSGLSPWSAISGSGASADSGSREELAARAAEAIRTLDERGAWIEKGSVGRADRVLQFFTAKDMVVTIGDRQPEDFTSGRSSFWSRWPLADARGTVWAWPRCRGAGWFGRSFGGFG
jgi:hypothetical protein